VEWRTWRSGTDTAGSIRVPAAWCGVVGLKTTHGLVPIEGVFPIEPEHLDTIGPMGKDIAHTVQGMDLLQNGFAASMPRPSRPDLPPKEFGSDDSLSRHRHEDRSRR
jgi:Asp-tRNA(Asn)/Glu-tRNA(Gln) amidotransferase A subunit family amidase